MAKSYTTLWTLERICSTVGFYMPGQVPQDGKRHWTLIAMIRLLTCVAASMFLQAFETAKALMAFGAFMPETPGKVLGHVFSQSSLQLEPLMTDGTHRDILVVMDSGMN